MQQIELFRKAVQYPLQNGNSRGDDDIVPRGTFH